MTDYGPTDTSTTTLGANQFPVSAVFVPGDTKLTTTQGGPKGTDVNGKTYAPVALYVPDGNDVTQGLSTDANTVNSVMGRLTKIRDLLLATLTVTGTLTANIGTTNGLALDSSVNGILLSQGSTTSGQKGALLQGAVTTSAPTYTTAQTSPLSLTTSGALRVDGSGVTQPISATSLPLPTGASTSAKQPALGTAGTASADVITVQGIASMTPLKVDGSGVTQPVSGTVSVNALPAGSALIGSVELVDSAGTNKAAIDAAGNQAVKGGFTEQSGLSAGALNADLVPSTDVSAYKWFSLHVTAVASGGTLTFQGSNDNVNFVNINAMSIGSASTGAYTTATTTTGIFANAVQFRYLRVRQTAWTSGSSTGVLELYTSPVGPYPLTSTAAIQSGTWTVQPGNTANTTPWLVNLPTSATGTLSSVVAAVSNTQLLAANASRKGMYVFNDSTAIMYLAFNATASTTSYTVQVSANGFFEMPTSPVYTGQINAVWSAAVGSARITEMS